MQCTKLGIYAGLLVALLAAGCAGSQASNKPKVAVLEFRGAKSGELHDTVREIFGDDYRLVSDSKYRAAARELRAKRMKSKHVRKVARELGVEAVVYGKVVRRSKTKYALSLRVRDGKTGKLLTKLEIPVRKKRTLSKKNARKLEKKLLALMEDVAPPPASDEADDDEDVAVAKTERKRKRSHRRSRKRADRDDDEDVAIARAEPERKPRRKKANPDDVELEDDFVIVDRMKGGQVIDDEVPPGLQ